MCELLEYYYRHEERDCDMIAMATNFDVVFDPSNTFRPDGEDGINYYNPTGIADEGLYAAAEAMSHTEPGDVYGYCENWIAFQEKSQEAEPMLPIFSNVYFDFYTTALQNYDVAANISWGQAIVDAYLSDAADAETEEEPAEEEPVEDEEPEEETEG